MLAIAYLGNPAEPPHPSALSIFQLPVQTCPTANKPAADFNRLPDGNLI